MLIFQISFSQTINIWIIVHYLISYACFSIWVQIKAPSCFNFVCNIFFQQVCLLVHHCWLHSSKCNNSQLWSTAFYWHYETQMLKSTNMILYNWPVDYSNIHPHHIYLHCTQIQQNKKWDEASRAQISRSIKFWSSKPRIYHLGCSLPLPLLAYISRLR